MASNQTGRLVLTSKPEAPPPPTDLLLAGLRDVGFIGRPLDDRATAVFLTGERFLQLVTFMGCSPHIQLDPPVDGGSFCHIRLEGPWPEPRLMRGRNTRPPRCAHCRASLSRWEQELDRWCTHPSRADVHCHQCGRHQRPLDLQWRRNAGFGRLFLLVEDIFPGEAVPVSSLMQSLRQTSGSPWDYFYVRD